MSQLNFIKRSILIICLLIFSVPKSLGWGFFAHKKINKHAVFTLPIEMIAFYKYHIYFITENAVNPDKRRGVVEGEAPKHFIDIDHYGDDALWNMPRYWNDAIKVYDQRELMQHGILPWHIYHMKHMLTKAFREKDALKILKLSADLGHYIADANVPLHTTENYNGQLTGQDGIHGFWESRLPELFFDNYDLLTRKATYVKDPQERAWKAIVTAHQAVDSLLSLEEKLNKEFFAIWKYTFEQRGANIQKVYSRAYAKEYHAMLNGQVERQLRASIEMVGDFWMTCWIDAGKPDLDALLKNPLRKSNTEEDYEEQEKFQVRTCD